MSNLSQFSSGDMPPPPPTDQQLNEAASRAQPDEKWLIRDLTASIAGPPREHPMMIVGRLRTLVFEYGKGVALPVPIAVKLLKHENFIRVDEDGNELEWKNPPRQPDEFGAGEQIRLADDQVIASLDELTLDALKVRAAQMPNGEALRGSKADIIAFIVKTTKERRAANIAANPLDATSDAWDPGSDEEGSFFGADS